MLKKLNADRSSCQLRRCPVSATGLTPIINSDDWHGELDHSAWGIVVIRFSSMSDGCELREKDIVRGETCTAVWSVICPRRGPSVWPDRRSRAQERQRGAVLRRERLRGVPGRRRDRDARRLRGRRLGLLSPARVPAVDRRALGIGGRWRPLGLDQGLCAQDRTLPSQDDHYWRCKSASERTCFLVPPRDF